MIDTRVYITLMRHGRSLADDEGKFEGRYDSPLTAVGQAQAAARAKEWLESGVCFDRVIASSLQRAAETARIVSSALGVPLELDAQWMELNNGQLAGLTFEEGDRLFPRPAFRSPYEPIAGNGESEIQIQARAALALERIVRLGPGHTLVVAHGGILNAAMRVVCSAPVPVNHNGVWFAFSDLGYVRLVYDPSTHTWVLRELRGNS